MYEYEYASSDLLATQCKALFDTRQGALYSMLKGFAYSWSGAHANVGITERKCCFSCKIISLQPDEMEDTAPDQQQHICRVGISSEFDSVGNPGETERSFGYGGTGKYLDHGENFGGGDTIVCALNLEERPFTSNGFFKNDKCLGVAKRFDADPRGLGFSVEDELVPEEGFKPWATALGDDGVNNGSRFF
ncbi:Concanavalin A-like lectin/glucanase domain containing protein [Parasponia andersonii]|uniref:Concanavalin A-like lectin/glucanase domain containing protein n=1 Tax=Parasponia andersonii TaxID=3476 RepID=A0A2P5DCB8_PARAD|nr:Concanavalin A-like lectin/glucanase domain containing protein [Parasponia andersonii]